MISCDRCKKQNPTLDTFKVFNLIVCQGCYRIFTKQNMVLIDPNKIMSVDDKEIAEGEYPRYFHDNKV